MTKNERVVRALLVDREDEDHLKDEALAETCNIILNSWGATISNTGAFKMSEPTVSRGDSNPMFESAT